MTAKPPRPDCPQCSGDEDPDRKHIVFFLDSDDGMGGRAVGLACNREVAERNLLEEIRTALDLLESGNEKKLVWLLTRSDLTQAELDALPEE